MNAQAAQRPHIIAHRGASGYLPEHSLAAKVLAYGQGADFLEQDVITSRDGVPVVFHDLYLDALTDVAQRFPGRARADGRHYCIDFDLRELRLLALRERIDLTSGTAFWPARFPPAAAAFSIPTLAEELALIRGLNQSSGQSVGIYPELKDPLWHQDHGIDLSRAVLDVLESQGYLRDGERIFLQCFDANTLQAVHSEPRARQLSLVQLIGSKQADLAKDLAAVAAYAAAIGPSIKLFKLRSKQGRVNAGRDLASEARAFGLAVHPYTFRADALPASCGSFNELLSLFIDELAVDALFTDFPDRVRSYLGGAEGSSGQR